MNLFDELCKDAASDIESGVYMNVSQEQKTITDAVTFISLVFLIIPPLKEKVNTTPKTSRNEGWYFWRREEESSR